MRKTYKKILALCAVLIFALALIPVTAFADPFTAIAVGGLSGASGGGLFGAMAGASGISIGYGSNTVDQADALWNGLNPDSVYFNGTKGQETVTDPQTGTETVYDYISVDIGDWLQAQNDFIDEFVSNYNVSDNSSGTISNTYSYFGYPFTVKVGNDYYGAQIGTIGTGGSFADISWTVNNIDQTYVYGSYNIRGITGSREISVQKINNPLVLHYDSRYGYVGLARLDNGAYYDIQSASYSIQPKSQTWTSGTVNTGVFDGYNAAKVMIPANSWSPSDPVNWDIDEFLAELTEKYVSGLSGQILIEDDDPGPVPPPPVPSTPLGEVPYDEWYDDMGDLIGQGVSEGLGDIEGDVHDTKEEVENQTGILQNILTGVQDLVQEIVLSTETFIAGLLNSIMGGLGGWLSTMREAFSIWHYVVEWVGSISTVFSWFWSVAGNTSYYIQLPIYASLAGAVVLAFYKRFGK